MRKRKKKRRGKKGEGDPILAHFLHIYLLSSLSLDLFRGAGGGGRKKEREGGVLTKKKKKRKEREKKVRAYVTVCSYLD